MADCEEGGDICKKIVKEDHDRPSTFSYLTNTTFITHSETSLSHGHTFMGYVWKWMKIRGRLKERRIVQFALVNQVNRPGAHLGAHLAPAGIQ